jgi:hypothetical protein
MTRILPSFRRHLLTACLGAILLGSALPVGAAPTWPNRLNYQGQLTDNLNQPVADGAYSITFRLYNVSSAGVAIWSETQSVNVAKGLFNAVLGTVTPLTLAPSYLTNDLWIGIEVNSNGEMVPRQQLLPNAQSVNSVMVNGATTGNGPNNLVTLDGTGKIPAGLVSGGSVVTPLDLSSSSGTFILRTFNSGTGVAISATAGSTAMPALEADGARYGATVSTADNAAGVALQASGPNGGNATLVDRVNNAQVFGNATASGTYGTLGSNTNASGTGAGGTGGYIGVSGSGGTYGAYTQGNSYGLYGKGNTYGVYGDNTSGNNYGVYGNGYQGVYGNSPSYIGVFGNGPTVGVYGSGGSYGLYGYGSTYGVYGNGTGSYGVYGINSATNGRGVAGHYGGSTAGYGVYGDSSSAANGTVGVYGAATSASGSTFGVWGQTSSNAAGAYGVYGKALASTGTAYGVRGESNSVSGTGVSGNGYEGVRGDGTYGVHGESAVAGGAGVLARSTIAGAPGLWADGVNIAISATANDPSQPTADIYNADQTSQSSIGLRGDAYGIGVQGEARYVYGTGVKGIGGYGFQAQSPYLNIWSDTSKNPTYGIYHYNGGAPSGSYGLYLFNQGVSSYGAIISNTSPGSSDPGFALKVQGKFQAPNCTGKYSVTGTYSGWSVSAPACEAGSNIIVTPAINIGAHSLYVGSVSAGSFVVYVDSGTVTNMSFYYWIIK